MNSHNTWAWVILAVALIVPGFIFYNWWSGINTENRKQMVQSMRMHASEQKLFAQGRNNKDRLVNPISRPSVVPVTTDADKLMPSAYPSAARLAHLLGVAATPEAVQAVVNVSSPTQGVSKASETLNIGLERDPTLSPYDLLKLQQLSKEEKLRKASLHTSAHHEKEEPPIENSIELQGIITTGIGRDKAIINGEMLAEGEMLGKVKILRITSSAVIFSYKHRQFTKSISQ